MGELLDRILGNKYDNHEKKNPENKIKMVLS